MKSHHPRLTLALCALWMLTLLYGEMFAFWVPSLFTCSWPPPPPVVAGATAPASYIKVAVIADPQLMDRTSLHLHPKSLALELAEFYSDLYMRRAFFASILPFKPDAIVFLGDYFDGGPYLSDEEWKESLHRFKHIFGMTKNVEYPDKVYFIAGNHDVGYSYVYSKDPEVVRRYEEVFGIRNFHFSLGEVEFIAVDSQTLDGLPQETSTSLTWEFVNNVSTDNSHLTPRVLLTHIPLYRPDNTYCGIHRYSPVVNQRISHYGNNREILYQNYISDKSSRQLLDLIKPALVLSGHDHDQCTVIYESTVGHVVQEHTVGTVSWQQGNLYPSFMLLSIRNSTNLDRSHSEELIMTRLCFLPMQTHIYLWYVCLFLLTLTSLLCWPASGFSFGHHSRDLVAYVRDRSSVFSYRTKEKNDVEDCEYDMVWGAEGSMHLVRKPLETTTSKGSNRASVERGNAVIRAAATRKCTHDIEESVSTDASPDLYGRSTRLSHRSSRQTTRIIVHRMARTLRMVTVIAAVNVPLYVMILFKDWVDS